MIEIRELVIKATIDNSQRGNTQNGERANNSDQNEKKGCCTETVDMILQIINDKKER
jgi:hypothetical protein